MASYELRFKRSVRKDLRAIANADVRRILDCIEALRSQPRPKGCEKLTGAERYRVRVGVYRVVYEIIDQQLIVIVVKVGHRRQVYRQVYRQG